MPTDKRPEWVRDVLGDEHFEGCHTNWESDGECICDRIAASVSEHYYRTMRKRDHASL